eukprot:TRINITY_DN14482_c0_g1_i1.p1 TRINITY_DN14482_c0_g1~~TRINITY_DN14482_c0_g1_i1.p1  ORF type:complete len:488 (+),score=66.04 TRINITY_DN14482_c0_g1_i1:52-1515(+)
MSSSGCPVEDNAELVKELLDLNDVTGNGYNTSNKVAEVCREVMPGDDEKIRYLIKAVADEDLLDERALVSVLKSLCFAVPGGVLRAKLCKVIDRLRGEQRERWLENPRVGHLNEEATVKGLYTAALNNAGGALTRAKLEPLVAALMPNLTRRDRKKAMKIMKGDPHTHVIPIDEIKLILEHAPQEAASPHPTYTPSEDPQHVEVRADHHTDRPGTYKDHMMGSTQLQGLLRENEELRACTKRLREQLEIVTQLKVRSTENQTGLEERCAGLESELAGCRAEVKELKSANVMMGEALGEAERAKVELGMEVEGLRQRLEEMPRKVVGNKSLCERHQMLRDEAAEAMQPYAYEPHVMYRLVTEYDSLVVCYDKKLHETKSRLHQHIRRVQQAETEFIRLASTVTNPHPPLGPNTAKLPLALEQLQDAMVLMSKIRGGTASPSPPAAASPPPNLTPTGNPSYSRMHSTTPNMRSRSHSGARPRRAVYDKL